MVSGVRISGIGHAAVFALIWALSRTLRRGTSLPSRFSGPLRVRGLFRLTCFVLFLLFCSMVLLRV